MIYCFDIDGTICSITDGDYQKAEPFIDIIKKINILHEQGHKIVFLTARGSTTGIDWREVTESQLRSWNVKYHELYLNKPHADIYIDDRGININEWLKLENKNG